MGPEHAEADARAVLFSPQAPSESVWTRLTAPLTRLGRARRRLRKAVMGNGSKRIWAAMKRDFKALSREERHRDLAVRVAETLLWDSISRRDYAGLSAEWFGLLPNNAENTQRLRWDILVLAADNGDYTIFRRFAFTFIRTGIEYSWLRLCFLVAYAYSCGERTDCIRILHNPPKEGLRDSELRTQEAAMALCTLPPVAPSLAWLLDRAKPIVPELLVFSPEMQADAFLVEARIADWSGSEQAMAESIHAAERIESTSPLVAYWRRRFALGRAETGTQILIIPTAENAAWSRLRKMASAIAEPTLTNAKSVLELLTEQLDDIESPEQVLISRVLRPILTATFEHSAADIKTIDLLCTEVENALSRSVDWTQYTHAFVALLEGNVDAAGSIVDAGTLPDNQSAAVLRKSIDVLRGRPENADLFHPNAFAGIGAVYFERVPCLLELQHMLEFASSLATGDNSEVPTVLERSLPSTAPSWIKWLQARLLFLAAPGRFLMRTAPLDVDDVMVAWEIDRIAREVLPLDACENEQVRQARRTVKECDVLEHIKMWGGRLGQLIALEFEIDRELRAVNSEFADRDLATGRTQRREVSKRRREILQGLRNRSLVSPVTAAFWVPVLEYWQGVASLSVLHVGSTPEFSTTSWMWPRALGQLALFAIAHGEMADAERWLDQAVAEHAGVVYARALLAARQGDAERCLKIVDGLTEAADDHVIYAQAATRLKAAILEREGDADGALVIYKALLERNPGDSIARTRGLRLLLQRSYGAIVDDSDAATLVGLADREIAGYGTFRRLQTIVRLLYGDYDIDLNGAPRSLSLLRGRRLLAHGELDAAEQAIESTNASASKLILQAARLLRDLGSERFDEAQSARYEQQLDICGQLLTKLDDEMLQPEIECWRRRVHKALEVLRAESDPNAQQQELLAIFQSDRWSMLQQNLAALLSVSPECVDEHYSVLLPELDSLPVAGADVWIVVARQWLKDGNFKELLESELPDCVADLEDPRVRLVIALGYAKACVEAFRARREHLAINWANRSRTTLEGLVEGADPVAEPMATV